MAAVLLEFRFNNIICTVELNIEVLLVIGVASYNIVLKTLYMQTFKKSR